MAIIQHPPSAFRASLPMLVTGLINKSGAIGLSLLPMMLVEQHATSATASIVMGCVKSTKLGGTFFGGWAGNHFGLKPAILWSCALAGTGVALMAVSPGFVALALSACLAQFGYAMYESPVRLFLVELVTPAQRQESIGWGRTVGNLGQCIIFSIGAVYSHLGMVFLLILDSATSWIATMAGWVFLPPATRHPGRGGDPSDLPTPSGHRPPPMPFAFCITILTGYSFLYDLFVVGAAGKYKLLYPETGLRMFSIMMIINTVLCAIFAVPSARFFRRPSVVFPAGIALTAVGSAWALAGGSDPMTIYAGMAVFTAGEIVFTSIAQFILIETTPGGNRQGSAYGMALTIQAMGRILGGVAAFPLIVHADVPAVVIVCCSAPVFALSLFIRPHPVAFKTLGPD